MEEKKNDGAPRELVAPPALAATMNLFSATRDILRALCDRSKDKAAQKAFYVLIEALKEYAQVQRSAREATQLRSPPPVLEFLPVPSAQPVTRHTQSRFDDEMSSRLEDDIEKKKEALFAHLKELSSGYGGTVRVDFFALMCHAIEMHVAAVLQPWEPWDYLEAQQTEDSIKYRSVFQFEVTVQKHISFNIEAVKKQRPKLGGKEGDHVLATSPFMDSVIYSIQGRKTVDALLILLDRFPEIDISNRDELLAQACKWKHFSDMRTALVMEPDANIEQYAQRLLKDLLCAVMAGWESRPGARFQSGKTARERGTEGSGVAGFEHLLESIPRGNSVGSSPLSGEHVVDDAQRRGQSSPKRRRSLSVSLQSIEVEHDTVVAQLHRKIKGLAGVVDYVPQDPVTFWEQVEKRGGRASRQVKKKDAELRSEISRMGNEDLQNHLQKELANGRRTNHPEHLFHVVRDMVLFFERVALPIWLAYYPEYLTAERQKQHGYRRAFVSALIHDGSAMGWGEFYADQGYAYVDSISELADSKNDPLEMHKKLTDYLCQRLLAEPHPADAVRQDWMPKLETKWHNYLAVMRMMLDGWKKESTSCKNEEKWESKAVDIYELYPSGSDVPWVVEDVSPDGNCFYRAVFRQFQARDLMAQYLSVLGSDAMVLDEDSEINRLREELGGGSDGTWAGEPQLIRLMEVFGFAVAIVDTRHLERGFLYHYIDDDGVAQYASSGDDMEQLLEHSVVYLAYTGSHYMSVSEGPGMLPDAQSSPRLRMGNSP